MPYTTYILNWVSVKLKNNVRLFHGRRHDKRPKRYCFGNKCNQCGVTTAQYFSNEEIY